VNAVVHRSYSLGGDHIRIEVFSDRIEVESPGRFPCLVKLTDPREVVRFARNPRIACVCADLQYGQELGEGIRRMFEEMQARGLAEPLYSQTPGTVRLTLSAIMVDPKLARQLPPRFLAIIDLIRKGPALSTGDIAEALGLSRPTTIRRLNALKSAGLIDWVGKSANDPRAYWRLHSE
jgi:ATP-dependent DNA helicase RecG